MPLLRLTLLPPLPALLLEPPQAAAVIARAASPATAREPRVRIRIDALSSLWLMSATNSRPRANCDGPSVVQPRKRTSDIGRRNPPDISQPGRPLRPGP